MSRIEELEKRLAKDPQSKVFAQLAEEYRKLGLLEDAIHTCREGLENHPNYFSARVALGRALLEANSLEEAAAELEKVLAQVPDNILANKFLGETYHKLGRLEEAIAKYRVAQALSPDDADISDRVSQVEAQQAAPPPSPPVATQDLEPVGSTGAPEVPVEPVAADASVQFETAQEVIDLPPSAGVPTPPVEEPAPEVIDLAASPGAPMPRDEEPPPPPAKRPAKDMGDASMISDEARAIQEEFEKGFPTDVMQRQAREIRNFEMMPPTETEAASPDILAEDPGSLENPFEVQTETQPPPIPDTPILETTMPEVPMPEPLVPELATEEQSFLGIEEKGPSEPRLESEPRLQAPQEPSPTEEPPPQPGLASTTLAELYASQGHIEQALEVFRDLRSSQPNDPKITERIEELEMLALARMDVTTPSKSKLEAGMGAQTIQKTIRVLEGWLAALR